MDTIIMRKCWLMAAKSLNDAQYREFITKVALYGMNECRNDVTSDDDVVNALLEMAKPSIKQAVNNYLG